MALKRWRMPWSLVYDSCCNDCLMYSGNYQTSAHVLLTRHYALDRSAVLIPSNPLQNANHSHTCPVAFTPPKLRSHATLTSEAERLYCNAALSEYMVHTAVVWPSNASTPPRSVKTCRTLSSWISVGWILLRLGAARLGAPRACQRELISSESAIVWAAAMRKAETTRTHRQVDTAAQARTAL
jgi:hypothetical protein